MASIVVALMTRRLRRFLSSVMVYTFLRKPSAKLACSSERSAYCCRKWSSSRVIATGWVGDRLRGASLMTLKHNGNIFNHISHDLAVELTK